MISSIIRIEVYLCILDNLLVCYNILQFCILLELLNNGIGNSTVIDQKLVAGHKIKIFDLLCCRGKQWLGACCFKRE